MGEAHELIRELDRLQRLVDNTRTKLTCIQNTCRHKWTEPKYDPIIKKGYTVEGREPRNYDEVGYVQGYIVPEMVIRRWTRECTICAKVQETMQANTHTQTTETPKW
jgi:hypothetical protein